MEIKDLLTFVSNVDTAFRYINAINGVRLCQFVLIGITVYTISPSNSESWEGLQEILKNSYAEKRTLGFHVYILFKVRQNKMENDPNGFRKSRR
jgi:hypothetical protein